MTHISLAAFLKVKVKTKKKARAKAKVRAKAKMSMQTKVIEKTERHSYSLLHL